MSDADDNGGRPEGCGRESGPQRRLRHGHYDEHWLQRVLNDVYREVADEPVPKELLDIAKRFSPQLDE